MPKPEPVILLTRPAAQAQEFASLLGADANVILSPALEMKTVPVHIDPEDDDSFVFTSQNAVQAAETLVDLNGRHVYAVGQRTAKAAADRGARVTVAGGTADTLIETIQADAPKGRLVFLRGKHTTGDLAKSLNALGIGTEESIVYEQNAKKMTNAAISALKGEAEVVLPLFSVRTATILSEMVAQYPVRASLTLICLSNSVAKAWAGPQPGTLLVAAQPTAAEMAKIILRHIGRLG